MGPVPLSLFPLVWAWDDAAIPWCNIDSTVDAIYLAEDCQSYQPIEQEMQQMTDILDAKYIKSKP